MLEEIVKSVVLGVWVVTLWLVGSWAIDKFRAWRSSTRRRHKAESAAS